MFELLVLILSVWLFFKTVGLMFRIGWCLSKFIAVILLILVFPALGGCILFAGGIVLLAPLFLLIIAFSLLNSCI